MLPREGGVRVVGAGRAAPALAHAPFCPPLAAGKKRELERSLHCSVRVQAEASRQTLLSVRPRCSAFGQLIGEGAAGRVQLSLSLFFSEGEFYQSVCCSAPRRRGAATLGPLAMSRRKLGSRPQHLSVIQGRSSGVWARGVDELCLFMGET